MTTLKQIEAFSQEIIVPGSIKGGMAALNAGRRDLWQVEPDKLRVIKGFNVRVDNAEYQAHVRALADSIKEHGFFQDRCVTISYLRKTSTRYNRDHVFHPVQRSTPNA